MAGDNGARKRSGGPKSRARNRRSGAGTSKSKKASKKAAKKRSKKSAKKRATRSKSARRKAERKKRTARRKATREESRTSDRPGTGPGRVAVAKRPSARGRAGEAQASPTRPQSARRLRYPERIGILRHIDHRGEAANPAQVAKVEIERDELRIGDALRISGPETDFYQRVETIESAGGPVDVARAGTTVTVTLTRPAQESDEVFLLSY